MRILLTLLVALSFGGFTLSSARADEAGAKAFVQDLANQAIDVLKDPNASPADKGARLDKIFEGHIAIDWVAHFVLGRHWKEITDDQKQAYVAAYKTFVIGSYSNRLQKFSGETYKILSDGQGSQPNTYLVAMEIDRPDGQAPVMVNYRIMDQGGTYQVYDLEVEGVSLIQTQRSEFDTVVTQHGIDYLIQQLKTKAANPQ